MTVALDIGASVVVVAGLYGQHRLLKSKYGTGPLSRKPKHQGRSTAMAHVLHQHPADSPGYTRLILREPVGHKQASATVTAHGPATEPNGEKVVHEIHLHGQREFDVPSGSVVRFPDGTDLHLDAD